MAGTFGPVLLKLLGPDHLKVAPVVEDVPDSVMVGLLQVTGPLFDAATAAGAVVLDVTV